MRMGSAINKPETVYRIAPAVSVCLAVAVLAVLTAVFAGSGAATTFTLFCIYLFIGAFLIFMEKWPSDERLNVLRVFLIAFFIRYACSQYLFPYFLVHWGFHFSDSQFYEKIGRLMALNWPDSPITAASRYNFIKNVGNHNGYYIFSAVHFLMDKSAQPISASNAFLSALVCWLTYRIIRRCASGEAGRRTALIGAWVFALFPLSIFWSSVNMKEAVVMFLTALFLDGFTVFLDKRFVSGGAQMLIAAVAMLHFRNYITVLFFIAFAASFVFMFIDFRKHRKVLLASLAAIALLLALAVAAGAFEKIYLFRMIIQKGILTFILEAPSGGFKELEHLAFSSPISMIKRMFTMVPQVVLYPLPHFPPGMRTAALYIVSCNIFWLLLFPFSFFGGWEALRHGRLVKTAPIALFTVMLVVALALVLITSARHVSSLYPCYCLFAAFGIAAWKKYIPYVFAIYFGLIVLTCSREDLPVTVFRPVVALGLAGLFFHILYAGFKIPKACSRARRAAGNGDA